MVIFQLHPNQLYQIVHFHWNLSSFCFDYTIQLVKTLTYWLTIQMLNLVYFKTLLFVASPVHTNHGATSLTLHVCCFLCSAYMLKSKSNVH